MGVRRAAGVILGFQCVCLAWVFFRATSFDNAVAMLRQFALGETDHANLVPLVTTALAVAGYSLLYLQFRLGDQSSDSGHYVNIFVASLLVS